MGRLLLLLSFLGIVFVAVGTVLWPQHLVFWFTATSPLYQYIRLGLGFVLLLQLITRPPRHATFRMLAGVIGLAALCFVAQQTYTYQMHLLDGLSLSAAALAILITALERRVEVTSVADPLSSFTLAYTDTK